ncbi:MAG: hypothetical protein V1899_10400 [Planctomycetota bacterium]
MFSRYGLRIGMLLLGLLGLSATYCADTVFLTNGVEIEGTVLEESTSTVVIKLRNGVNYSLRRIDVDTIVYEIKAAPKASAPVGKSEIKIQPAKSDNKIPSAAKSDDKKVNETKTNDSKTKKDDKETNVKKDEDDWSPPPELAGFPDKAKRMDKVKESIFMSALEKLANNDETVRRAAQDEIIALGAESLPYVVAGINHTNVNARSVCMTLVSQFNGRSAIKQVIEVFFSAMPETGEAATWQVPFIRAIKSTLPAISGQSFITGEANNVSVQNGLTKYIDWYQANYDRLPPQLGEPKLDATDPEYDKKLKEARALKLAKRSWPRPPVLSDLIVGPNKQNDRPSQPAGAGERAADKIFRDSMQKVKNTDALNRDVDKNR